MGQSGKHRARGAWFLSVPAFVIAGVVVLGLTAGGVVLATTQLHNGHGATLVTSPPRPEHRHTAPRPIAVASVRTITTHAAAVRWDTSVTVRFTQPVAASSPRPIIRPPLPGTWTTVDPTTIEFHPDGSFAPYTHGSVIVPAQVRSTAGAELGHKYVVHFRVEGASVLRLQELLGELGYLPVSFAPAPGATPAPRSGVHAGPAPAFSSPSSAPNGSSGPVGAPPAPSPRDLEPHNPRQIPLEPLAGSFSWRFKNIPGWLAADWASGQANVVTTGAVMAFEAAHGLPDDGVAGPLVWSDLLKAVAARQLDRAPYDYVYVSEGSPEYVTVWRDGVNVFTTLANTGIPQAPTAQGTWPVYVRYVVTTMSGTNPDGSHYADPGIPWVSYFHGGDALHGFLRASYGFPQSLGCVEMPYAAAQAVFPYTPIGTLVTVE